MPPSSPLLLPQPMLALSSSPALYLVLLRAAGGLPRFGLVVQDRLRTSALGELVRQRWLNMPLEYPTVGFERFAVHPDRFEALVRLGGGAGGRSPLRGIIAHFKATVTRDAPGESPVWAKGYQVVALTSRNGTSITIPSRAMTVAGKMAMASSSNSGASRE